MLSNESIERIVNRHIGRVLQRLDEVNTTSIVKECVKGEMWLISDDVKKELEQKEETNNGCQKEDYNR